MCARFIHFILFMIRFFGQRLNGFDFFLFGNGIHMISNSLSPACIGSIIIIIVNIVIYECITWKYAVFPYCPHVINKRNPLNLTLNAVRVLLFICRIKLKNMNKIVKLQLIVSFMFLIQRWIFLSNGNRTCAATLWILNAKIEEPL